jgi:hypothetical protein
MPGDGLKAVCGDQVFNQQSSDHYGNVQGALQNLQGSHPDCRMWQCKGVPFSDAKEADIQQYKAGDVVSMKVEIRAPHDGVANVSIVSVSSDKVVGKPLITWDEYALTSSPIDQHPDWTGFNFTMPDVSSECAKAGDCVIQWFWDAPKIDQTYESCVDFSMGGGSGSGSIPAASSTPKASASAAPSSTVPEATATPEAELPETFTLDTFVAWLRKNAGTGVADKVRRMVAARAHPRAFRV